MQSLRSLALSAIGLLLVLAAFVFTASLGLILAGLVSLVMIGSAVSARFSAKPAPVRCQARTRRETDAHTSGRVPRIWNDGRGTIIDL
ncbi:hypothetical protein BJF93_15645 [Xaviernesmea oryzae]|uniref:Uncharacterized protein n=1 Tax=Xaviernesmea oryzae TaxID=464029 RepID=A0A1Q9AY42_9HYPH|nr:hypothetical protein [Xaviernesmea oryzae]OLP60378.1 hypothetical protein BJF93_15645 [Xaviernesmea oryzae]SEK20823.1 hypothetical protein SAMN04487976_10186 [Xaviernesmea oryzae]